MPYAIQTKDKPDHGEQRAALRDEHLAFLDANVGKLLAAGAVIDDDGFNAAFVRLGKAGRTRAIGQNKADFSRKVLGFGGLEERHHVASAPGNQNRSPGFRHRQDCRR